MERANKNIVIGGIDVRLNRHGQKGFRVKFSKNLDFDNGHITAKFPVTSLCTLLPSLGPENHDNDLINQLVIIP